MLAANPETSGVYYVDDHFVPYAGAKPVAKRLEQQQAGPGGEGPSPPRTADDTKGLARTMITQRGQPAHHRAELIAVRELS